MTPLRAATSLGSLALAPVILNTDTSTGGESCPARRLSRGAAHRRADTAHLARSAAVHPRAPSVAVCLPHVERQSRLARAHDGRQQPRHCRAARAGRARSAEASRTRKPRTLARAVAAGVRRDRARQPVWSALRVMSCPVLPYGGRRTHLHSCVPPAPVVARACASCCQVRCRSR